MAYEDFKYLPGKTASDKPLLGIAFNVAKDLMDGYQIGFSLTVYNCFDNYSMSLIFY